MTWFTRFLLKRAGLVLLMGALLCAFGVYYSVHLFSNLRTDIEELLPTDARSVVDLNEVRARLESTNSLSVLVLSSDVSASKRFVDDLATEITKLPKTVQAGVEYRINQELAFFNDRKSLFIDTKDLVLIRNFIKNRINYEMTLYNPLTILENVDIPEPKLDFEKIKNKYSSKTDSYSHFPGGYYATPDEKKRVLLVNLPGEASGISGSKKLKENVAEVVAHLRPTSYAADLEVHYSGGVQDSLEENEALVEDLALSTIVVCILVTIAMLIYFRSILGTIALLSALFLGTAVTFGVSYFLVGYLNANSAFMGSIVIGNGINFGIILLARFIEERRKHKSAPRCIAIAVEKTFPATVVAALAAGLAYGSLMLTSFRGFRQFGVIGFVGMMICYAASYTVLPSMLLVFYKWGGFRKTINDTKHTFIKLISRFIQKFPKAIIAFTAIVTIASALMLPRIDSSIIETDFKKLRNRHSLENGSIYWSASVDDIFKRYLSPLVVLPTKAANVLPIAESLKRAKAADGEKSDIVGVSTIQDFIPTMQKEKIAILRDIKGLLPRKLLVRLNPHEQSLIRDLLDEHSMKPFTPNDLPELVKGKFREKDGSIGKLVLVEPTLSDELSQSDHLIHFVNEIRKAADEVEPGVAVAGSLPVTSDMFESIVRDGPKATLFAFLAVFILVIILFRDVATIAQCSFALLMGILWLAGYILAFHEKINFLNFIALPITFGIGVDYGVNIFERYRREKDKGIIPVIEHTGGAVLLASFTTVTGYGSLVIASNQAFVSFGKLAILGELTCVFAAVISLPAIIWYKTKK